ncbi:hypothetical protein QJQ45_026397 [Haematococcus lacustris]|nr:hypothetical protein QJQ45_026397 [Haematococcus lacustris]
MQSGLSVQEYLAEAEDLHERINSTGTYFDTLCQALLGLPPDYQQLVQSILEQPLDEQLGRLGARVGRAAGGKEMVARGGAEVEPGAGEGFKGSAGSVTKGGTKRTNAQIARGGIASGWGSSARGRDSNSPSRHLGSVSRSSIAFSIVTKMLLFGEWVIDSGCSRHLTPHRELLHDYQHLHEPHHIIVANGGRIEAQGQGVVCFEGVGGAMQLLDVLHVPEADGSLVLVGKATRAGGSVHFTSFGCSINTPGAKHSVRGTQVELDLFLLDSKPVPVAGGFNLATRTCSDPLVLHHRPGHPGYRQLARLLREGMVRGTSVTTAQCEAAANELCEPCVMGKQTSLEARQHAGLGVTATRPLMLVHSDVCDVTGQYSAATPDIMRYFVILLDEFSGLVAFEPSSKLTSRGIKGVFVGYEEGGKAHQVWAEGRLYVNKSVVFDEQAVLRRFAPVSYAPAPSILVAPPSAVAPRGGVSAAGEQPGEQGGMEQGRMGSGGGTPSVTPTVTPARHNANRGGGSNDSNSGGGGQASSRGGPPVAPDSSGGDGVGTGWACLGGAGDLGSPRGMETGTPDTVPALRPALVPPERRRSDRVRKRVEFPDFVTLCYSARYESNSTNGSEREGDGSRGSRESSGGAASQPAEPRSFSEAMSRPDAEEWGRAMDAEMASQHANQTWEMVSRQPGMSVLPGRWVLKAKRGSDGNIVKYKARRVVKGYRQRDGVDYFEDAVFAPVVMHTTQRLVFAQASLPRQCRRAGASGRLTSKRPSLTASSQTEGADEAAVLEVKQQLQQAFDVHDLGQAADFLGKRIAFDRAAGILRLTQEQYIEQLLQRFGLAESNPRQLPLSPSTQLVKEGEQLSEQHTLRYRELVGGLLWLSICTRPDIASAVGQLTRYMQAPTREHEQAVQGVLQYLRGMAGQGLVFRGSCSGELVGFCDSDYASCKQSGRSTTGYVFILFGATVSVRSKLQTTVATSTAEAQYQAVADAIREALFLRKLLHELYAVTCPIPILKHIAAMHQMARERVRHGEVEFSHCPTPDMVADALTKALPGPKLRLPLLMRVIKADVELGRRCQASWSAQFQLAARELMGGEFTLSPDMVLGTKAMEVKWLERWGRRWVGFEGDPRLPETVHRERCSYAAWFKHGDGIGINHMAPHLLNRQLSTEVRTSLTRFRLGNNGLGVEKARFEGVTFINRTCTRCTEGVVDDAMHFIFECTATSSIREQPEFAMTLQNNNENLHDFMLSPCAPLFVHLALKCVTESPEPLEGEGGLAA